MSASPLDEVPDDDPRRLLPRPVFEQSRRQSGFPAYVSPRGRPLSNRQRQALSYMNFGGPRQSASQGLGLMRPKGWALVEDQWRRRLEREGRW